MHFVNINLVTYYCTNTSVCYQVALVSQSLELFSGSLRYNIEYGLKDCNIEKVKEAAKKANADSFISELKNEYDTGTNTHSTFYIIQIGYHRCH